MTSNAETWAVANALVDLADVLFAFAAIERTARFPDGVRFESDTDHTVMLGWVACALAEWCAPDLDLGLVAQFALIHDMPEALAGDTCTLRPLSERERAAKAERERAATAELVRTFASRLPWVSDQLQAYEQQVLPEARFVRGVDKMLPELTHLLNNLATPRSKDVDVEELTSIFKQLVESMRSYVGEFSGLMELHDVLIDRVLTQYRQIDDTK